MTLSMEGTCKVLRLYGSPEDLFLKKIENLCLRHDVDYEIRSTTIEANLIFLYERGHMEIPQVFDDDVHIGGCTDLVDYIELVREIETRKAE